MEKIIDSSCVHSEPGFEVYAEVCESKRLDRSVFSARIVECLDDKPDMVMYNVELPGLQGARDALDSLVASYRRKTGRF